MELENFHRGYPATGFLLDLKRPIGGDAFFNPKSYGFAGNVEFAPDGSIGTELLYELLCWIHNLILRQV